MGIRNSIIALSLLLAGCAGPSKVEVAKAHLEEQIEAVRTAMENTYDVIPFECRTEEVSEGFDNIRYELDYLYVRTENMWALHEAEVGEMQNDMWKGFLLGVLLSIGFMIFIGKR